MGKKSARKKNKEEQRKMGEAFQKTAMKETRKLSDKMLSVESTRLLEKLNSPRLSLDEVTSIMRQLLAMCGTDNAMNDNDPYGDGDQSVVGERGLLGEGTRQIPRRLWARGGDMEHYLIYGLFTPLAYSCAIGNASQ
eukprot:15223374-Ditylum_brightwellii.AAC.1